jgi:hypothetical protein
MSSSFVLVDRPMGASMKENFLRKGIESSISKMYSTYRIDTCQVLSKILNLGWEGWGRANTDNSHRKKFET